MNTRTLLRLVALISFAFLFSSSSAQDIGFQVDDDKDVLFGDSTTGVGARLMWISDRNALRSGEITSDCANCWDLDNIGFNSFASGTNSRASGSNSAAWGMNTISAGTYSTAWGLGTLAGSPWSTTWGDGTSALGIKATAWGANTIASGDNSTAWGSNTNATGSRSTTWGIGTTASLNNSTAWGNNTNATGPSSTSWGGYTTASGNSSTAWGDRVIAASFAETAIGSYNTTYTPSSTGSWDLNDRLFVIGNGINGFNRSDAMVILKNGNLGLGENQPAALLHLSKSITGDSTGLKITNDNFNSLFYHDDNGHFIIRKQNQTNQLVLDESGNIGLGTTANTHPLELASGAHCTSAGIWTNASDERLKENIKTTQYGLKEILSLHPVDYKMKATGEDQVGFIAQQVAQIIPEVVSGVEGDINEGETLGLSYGNLVAVLTKGIQEQQEELVEQRAEIERLNQRLANIEKMISVRIQRTENQTEE